MKQKVYLFTLNTETFQVPSRCVSCLGPADTVFRIVKGKGSSTRWIGNQKYQETQTLSVSFPYCSACAELAKNKSSREKLISVLKYLLIPMSMLLSCMLLSELLSLFLPLDASSQWYVQLPVFAVTFGVAVAVFAWLEWLAAQSVPPQTRQARDPAGWYPGQYGNVLYVRDKNWADLFGLANGFSASEAEL